MFGFFKKKSGPGSLLAGGCDSGGRESSFVGESGNVAVMDAPPPAPEALVKMEDPVDEKPGLELRFSAGERIPWKGIWFRVSEVKKMCLSLVPEDMTWKMAKKVQARKQAVRKAR